MTLSAYFLYLAAVVLLVLSHGPSMLMRMTNSITRGAPKATSSAAGRVAAVLRLMLLSSFGLAAVLAASDAAFNVLRLCGAAYLIYLGIKTFCSPASSFDLPPDDQATQTSKLKLFAQGLWVGASDPKAILFFTALFAQFLDTKQAWTMQFAMLGRAKVSNRVSGSLFAGVGGLLLVAGK